MKDFKGVLLTGVRAVIFGAVALGAASVMAWTAAPASPPASNVAAPINTSATAQTKAGSLILSAGFLSVTSPNTAAWAGTFDNTGGIYGLNVQNSTNYAYVDYGHYGLYTNGALVSIGTDATLWGANIQAAGANGLYADNSSGKYAELAYGIYGLNTNGRINTSEYVYADDVYLTTTAQWASVAGLAGVRSSFTGYCVEYPGGTANGCDCGISKGVGWAMAGINFWNLGSNYDVHATVMCVR